MFVQSDVEMRSLKSDSETIYPSFELRNLWKHLRFLSCEILNGFWWSWGECCSLPRTKFHEILNFSRENFQPHETLRLFSCLSLRVSSAIMHESSWPLTFVSPATSQMLRAINVKCTQSEKFRRSDNNAENGQNRQLTLRKIIYAHEDAPSCDGRETFFIFCSRRRPSLSKGCVDDFLWVHAD